ncbi:MAG: GtrA family protein [Desulfoplanes sp.]|nr:GtrA family protein [Paludibacter sp.]MDD4648524.1 GtrA family protein [Desulfoplanes sp.]
MIKLFFTKQFVKFLVSGGGAAIIHWLSRILLNRWVTFSWAITFAYFIGMVVAFTLNSFFVFPKSEKSRCKQARDFFIVNISFFPVVLLISKFINHILQSVGIINYTQAIAHGIAVTIPTFATFLIYKFFAFKDTQYERF